MNIIDTHSHFNLSQFDADREAAVGRMQEAGVGTICVGVDEETSAKAIEIANTHGDIWASMGIHPTHWGHEWDQSRMDELANKREVVAVGECGLDYFREDDRKAKPEQKALFAHQIKLAHHRNLPLILHIRPQQGHMDAYEEALLMLQEARGSWEEMRGTAHFFVGTKEIAEEFLNLGFHISFSGVITIFPEYETLVHFVPLDRILPETDAPFAAPFPYRGKRNEPAYVLEVVKKIAHIKELPFETVQEQLLKNAKELFKI
ncbi:MAG TPA: TatD family hydrolase [Candidatus Paceibacterota bacterium]|nr:TatD family hydrolase [Candidatus Paceibacterota bacterium]